MLILKIITNITHLMMCFASLFLIIYGFIKNKELGDLKIFYFLVSLSFLDSLSLIIFTKLLDLSNEWEYFSGIFQTVYLTTEIAVIIFFYSRIIFKNYNKMFPVTNLILIVTLLLLNYFFKYNIYETYYTSFVIFEVVIVNTFFGIISIKYLKYNIVNKSDYEINKGLFIFINITAPYYIVGNYLGNSEFLFTTYTKFINDLGYIILFFQIYKSHRCSIQR